MQYFLTNHIIIELLELYFLDSVLYLTHGNQLPSNPF